MTELSAPAVSGESGALEMPTLPCSRCHKDKPDAEFSVDRGPSATRNRRGRSYTCKTCRHSYDQNLRDRDGGGTGGEAGVRVIEDVPSTTTLRCHACGKEKDDEEFHVRASLVLRRGRQYNCKECTAKKDHERNNRPPVRRGKRPRAGARRKAPDELEVRRAAKREEARLSGQSIRDLDRELKYRAMLNAPPGVTNVPMLDRASRVVELLSELGELDPVGAAHMMPIERVLEYAGANPDWWRAFTEECEVRRRSEIPDRRPLQLKSDVVHRVVGRKVGPG